MIRFASQWFTLTSFILWGIAIFSGYPERIVAAAIFWMLAAILFELKANE